MSAWIESRKGTRLSERAVSVYPVKAGFARQLPRPKHPDADQEAQDIRKKGGSRVAFSSSFENPRVEIQIWGEAEARHDPEPTYRRVWAHRGQRPTTSPRRKYQWKYLYSFVRNRTGETLTSSARPSPPRP